MCSAQCIVVARFGWVRASVALVCGVDGAGQGQNLLRLKSAKTAVHTQAHESNLLLWTYLAFNVLADVVLQFWIDFAAQSVLKA